MTDLEGLIREYELRYEEALECFEVANSDEEDDLAFWEAEVVIIRDTISYLRTLKKFMPVELVAPLAN